MYSCINDDDDDQDHDDSHDHQDDGDSQDDQGSREDEDRLDNDDSQNDEDEQDDEDETDDDDDGLFLSAIFSQRMKKLTRDETMNVTAILPSSVAFLGKPFVHRLT